MLIAERTLSISKGKMNKLSPDEKSDLGELIRQNIESGNVERIRGVFATSSPREKLTDTPKENSYSRYNPIRFVSPYLSHLLTYFRKENK